MPVRSRIVLAILWAASLVAVAWTRSSAQSDQRVVSGSDIGFRVERVDSRGTPLGSIVVKIDGKWVEVGFTAKAVAR